MSVPTSKPCFIAGAIRYSGAPNTGEVNMTRGGAVAATIWSGGLLSPGSGFTPGAIKTADHLQLVSGGGRLNNVILMQPVTSLSGIPITFYDAGTVLASGLVTGGAVRVLAVVNQAFGVSGQITGPGPQFFDTPFSSGLCVACTSGTPGWTATYTPEVN